MGFFGTQDEGQATAQALQRNLTPDALAKLLSTMRGAPEMSFGAQQNPDTLQQAASGGVLQGDRLRTLLALLMRGGLGGQSPSPAPSSTFSARF